MQSLGTNKFTPGPWRVGPYYRHEVVSSSGVICCGPIETEQTRANATLIAAAPELYEALNRMLVSFAGEDEELCMECGEKQGTGESCDTCYVIGKAIEVLAKVRGESQ